MCWRKSMRVPRRSVYARRVADAASTDARIRFAIANRRLVELRYKGYARVVEPHDYGVQNGAERLLVFQRRGPARAGQDPIGWRLLETGADRSARSARGHLRREP